MVKRVVIIFVLFLFTFTLRSQDIHFSQVYLSPLSLSPMQTGNFDGNWRFSNNYRSQWRTVAIPYTTISAGFDAQWFYHNEHLSWGIYILNDKSGHVFLDVTKIYLSFAWHKTVNLNNFHLGLQGGYVHKGYDMSRATFPSQFDMTTGAFNSSLNNGEMSINDVTGYPDLNFAAGWSRRFGRVEPEIAVSLFHLTMPRESFVSDNSHLPIREILSARMKTYLGSRMVLTPTLFGMGQRNAADLIGGLRFDFFFRPNPQFFKGIFMGGYYRMTPGNLDAAILQGGLTFKKFEIGVSYDRNISPLNVATGGRGAFEIALIYTGANTMLNKTTIPCERM
jgi:type IX secretion system PorP/SprF family membrane protein